MGSADAPGATVGDAIAVVEHTHFATGKTVVPSGLTKTPSFGKPLAICSFTVYSDSSNVFVAEPLGHFQIYTTGLNLFPRQMGMCQYQSWPTMYLTRYLGY